MAYFQDLSAYTGRASAFCRHTLNVGWLDSAYSFPKALVSADAAEMLWNFCKYSVGQCRGFHVCNLPGCQAHVFLPVLASRNGLTLELGSAEIRVFGNNGITYAAPNLIYHYVTVHNYQMPKAFVSALREGPLPGSAEYLDRLNALVVDWSPTLLPDPRDPREQQKPTL